MTVPTWLADAASLVMVVVIVLCLGRMAMARHLGRRCSYDGDGACVLMGLLMIWMLQPSLTLSARGLWQIIFALMVLWFLAKTLRELLATSPERRRGGNHVLHHVCHAVMALAMVLMLSMGSSTSVVGGMRMTGAGHDPIMSFVIGGILLGFCVWQLDGIWAITTHRWPASSDDGQVAVGTHVLLAPRLELGVYAAMAAVMAFTLLAMR